MTPEDLSDLLWKGLRKLHDRRIVSMHAGTLLPKEFEVRDEQGHCFIVIVKSVEESQR